MTRRSKTLSPGQQLALEEVHASKSAHSRARMELEIELRRQLDARMNELELDLAVKIRRAHTLEVPIARIANEGLGTTDRATVRRWLDRTERLQYVTAGESPSDVFSYTPERHVRVSYRNFPTTSMARDYPEVLTGVVRRDDAGAWVVVEDPGTVDTEMGPLVGHLTWEIETVSPTTPNSLHSFLDTWIEANS